mgnify:FL=1
MLTVCPVDAVLGDATDGECSSTCEGGTLTQTQTCTEARGCGDTTACTDDVITENVPCNDDIEVSQHASKCIANNDTMLPHQIAMQ